MGVAPPAVASGRETVSAAVEAIIALAPRFDSSTASANMSVLQYFEEYQKARVKFVQAVAEAATRPQNIEVMNNAGVMQLLRPLLLDNVPSIQQTAALALGRLANYSEDLAEAVVGNEILPQLVYSLADQNVSFSIDFLYMLC